MVFQFFFLEHASAALCWFQQLFGDCGDVMKRYFPFFGFAVAVLYAGCEQAPTLIISVLHLRTFSCITRLSDHRRNQTHIISDIGMQIEERLQGDNTQMQREVIYE